VDTNPTRKQGIKFALAYASGWCSTIAHAPNRLRINNFNAIFHLLKAELWRDFRVQFPMARIESKMVDAVRKVTGGRN
jgi:hypothetical protein